MHQFTEVSQRVWKCHLTSERYHIWMAFVVGLPRQQSKSILQCGPRESSAWTFPACVQSIKFKENNKDKPWWPHTSKHRWIQGLLWKALCTCTGSAWFDVTNYLRINTSCSVSWKLGRDQISSVYKARNILWQKDSPERHQTMHGMGLLFAKPEKGEKRRKVTNVLKWPERTVPDVLK